MGRMYFPGEKAKEYLPPRESEGDFVARFGAWLTEDGAACIAYIACAIPAVMGGVRLLKWMYGMFQENFFYGIFSIIGAAWMVGLSMIPLYILYFLIYAVAWLLGWLCYNKWTLIIGLLVASLCYVFFFAPNGLQLP